MKDGESSIFVYYLCDGYQNLIEFIFIVDHK